MTTSVIEVAIGYARDPGRFRVQVVDSPVGHASADVDLDVGALLAGRGGFEQALLLSGIPARRILSDEERLVQETGKSLFTALLGTGGVAGRYRSSVDRAADRAEELRIVLRVDVPELAALPWEAMYDEGTGGYVCRQHQLVRHVPVAAAAPPLAVKPPLRILGVVSAPRDLPPLQVNRERDQLTRALAGPIGAGLVELAWAPSATWAALHDTLMSRPWHVVHFIGHGDFDPLRDEGRIALTSEHGLSDEVAASRLADLLRQARPMPRLMVLNSCQGAAASTSDLFSGTAAALTRNGIPAVVAMQYSISDAAAIAFARGFYTALARARGVDDAVSSGRVAILGTSGQTLEWVTPVLYLRGRGSRLFDVQAATGGPSSRQLVRTLGGHADAVNEVGFAPGGALVATTSSDKTVRLWDAATGSGVHMFAGHLTRVSPMAFSPDGSLLATASDDRGSYFRIERIDTSVRLWDLDRKRPAHVLAGHAFAITALAFSPDGALLASAGLDQTVKVWDTASGGISQTLACRPALVRQLSSSPLWCVAVSPDGALVAAGGADKTARLWTVTTGALVHTLAGHDGEVREVAFSPDGALLATASSDGTARLWTVATGAPARVLTGHEARVTGLAFSPGGRLLATSGYDGTARLWDSGDGGLRRTLAGHAGPVLSARFSPDGTLLATASQDKTARVWDVATGECVSVLRGHTGQVSRAVFSPDGTLLATASADMTARLWVIGTV